MSMGSCCLYSYGPQGQPVVCSHQDRMVHKLENEADDAKGDGASRQVPQVNRQCHGTGLFMFRLDHATSIISRIWNIHVVFSIHSLNSSVVSKYTKMITGKGRAKEEKQVKRER